MSEFSRKQSEAASLGVAGARTVGHTVEASMAIVVREAMRRIVEAIKKVKAARYEKQLSVAGLARGLNNSSASTLVSSPQAEATVSSSVPESNTVGAASSAEPTVFDMATPEQRAAIEKAFHLVREELRRASENDLSVEDAEALAREYNRLIKVYGDARFAEQSILTMTKNSRFFKESTQSRQQLAKVAASTSRVPPEKDAKVTSEQSQVIEVTSQLIPDMESLESTVNEDSNFENDFEIEIVEGDVNEKSGTTPVSLASEFRQYEGEEFSIYRSGRVVTITDRDNQPIFRFEYNEKGRIKVQKDKITNNPELHQTFVNAKRNLDTLAPHRTIKDVLADKTHQAQAKYLGGLAPRGSTALATAFLMTSDTRKVSSKSETYGNFIYKRETIHQEKGPPTLKLIVEQSGRVGRDAVVAVSENSQIVDASSSQNYAQLKKTYEKVKGTQAVETNVKSNHQKVHSDQAER